MRVPTLNTARQAFEAIEARQAEQARLQSQVSSGLRVGSPGDDPLAAAQAELARSRLARLAQDQRATQLAASLLKSAEGALAHGVGLLQNARETLVAAGNGTYTAAERQQLALQLRTTRQDLLALANTRDSGGGYVFAGQASAGEPVAGGSVPVFGGAAGVQRIGEDGRYAASVDGRDSFMTLPQGNGVFVTASAPGNAGTGWIDAGSVGDPALLTGNDYRITMGGAPGALTYTVLDTTSGSTLASNQPLAPGAVIEVQGQRVTISGEPVPGDFFTLAPAGRQSVFRTLDEAIAVLESTTATRSAFQEGLARAHTSVDRALDGLILMRTRVGEELRSVDDAQAAGQLQEIAVAGRRSELQDLDLAKGISQLHSSQTGLEAALKTYASIARTSLFQLLG